MTTNSRYIMFLFLLVLFVRCSPENPTESKIPTAANDFLVDTLATPKTVALFRNLQELTDTGVMFGHQDATAYGVGWWAEPGRSDVKEVCGDYPAVYGWDLGDIHEAENLDGANFNNMQIWIKEAYARGGIITISMHLDNPVSGGNAWDNSSAVSEILPNRPYHAQYINTLSKIASFLSNLKTSDGIYIPVILRPYHEHSQSWPWWGMESCTSEEFYSLWQMTVEYFRDEKGIHHLLYAISPQDINYKSQYFERYPGDDWVDILGLDYYSLHNSYNIIKLGEALDMLGKEAEQRGKIMALTEVGVNKITVGNWWTNYLLTAIKYSEYSRKTAWALVWRNYSTEHHFAPFPGHESEANFLNFYQNSFTIFESDLPEMYE